MELPKYPIVPKNYMNLPWRGGGFWDEAGIF